MSYSRNGLFPLIMSVESGLCETSIDFLKNVVNWI